MFHPAVFKAAAMRGIKLPSSVHAAALPMFNEQTKQLPIKMNPAPKTAHLAQKPLASPKASTPKQSKVPEAHLIIAALGHRLASLPAENSSPQGKSLSL